MNLIYLNCIISNLCRRKISIFLSKDEILVKKMPTSLHEKKSMTSVDSKFKFLCGRPHGAEPPPPSTCVNMSLTPSPLRVDVINGWPLIFRSLMQPSWRCCPFCNTRDWKCNNLSTTLSLILFCNLLRCVNLERTLLLDRQERRRQTERHEKKKTDLVYRCWYLFLRQS